MGIKPQGWLWAVWTWSLPACEGNQAPFHGHPRENRLRRGLLGTGVVPGQAARQAGGCKEGLWRSWQDGQLLGTAMCQWHWGRQCQQGSTQPGQQQGADVPCGTLQAGIPRSAHDAWSCSWQGSRVPALVCTGSTALLPCLKCSRKTWQTWPCSPLAHTAGTDTPALPREHWAALAG